MEPSKSNAGRGPGKKEPEQVLPSLKITQETDRLLTAHAKKLKVSKRQYGNAAIIFFAESGLDPTAERSQNLDALSKQVSVDTRAVRVQNADIGNRLITILRTWEKNLYGFLQQQELSRNNYLELIESNILQHQVLIETNILGPMVENLFKVNLEAFITRGLASQLLVKVTNQPEEGYQQQMEVSNNGRDQQLAMRMREFLKTNAVPLPKPTVKRPVTPVPAKPVVPATPAPTSPPKP